MPQRYGFFLNRKLNLGYKKHFHIIHRKHAHQAGLPDLVAVQQFELLRALVEIIAQRYAVSPLLDFTALDPQLYIHWVASFEHLAQGGNVDGLCHISYRWG